MSNYYNKAMKILKKMNKNKGKKRLSQMFHVEHKMWIAERKEYAKEHDRSSNGQEEQTKCSH